MHKEYGWGYQQRDHIIKKKKQLVEIGQIGLED
jgi:hypothetical protein